MSEPATAAAAPSVESSAGSSAASSTLAAAAPVSVAHKSPALGAIKVLAPLPPSDTTQAAAEPAGAGAGEAAGTPNPDSTSGSNPPALFLASDDVGDVAKARHEHLLHSRWSFWYDLKDQGKPNQQSWGASLKKLMDFESVEQFFGMVNNIAKPSALPVGSDYLMFLYGVKPEWEDPVNYPGGKWVWELRKTDDVHEMDKLWLHTLLAIIGENFTDENEVNGVVISLRKGRNRIALWTRHDNAKVAQRVGQEWKKILMLPQTVKLGFTSHSQAMKKSSAHEVQNLFTV